MTIKIEKWHTAISILDLVMEVRNLGAAKSLFHDFSPLTFDACEKLDSGLNGKLC